MSESENAVLRTDTPFIHLRVHSAYSLSEGALHIKQLAQLAADMQMPALAITDTNNLFGALEFSETLKNAGIQPIIGCWLAVSPETHQQDRPASLALLAKNETGYANLMKLSSRAFLEPGAQAEAHVDFATLSSYAEGLICLSGGPGGWLNRPIADGQMDLAQQRLRQLKQLFGDRLYIELQRHQLYEETAAETGLIELAYDHELPLVATNDCHFAEIGHFSAHDALLCIADGELVNNEDRRRLTPEHYFKHPRDMATLFADVPEAVANTIEIAQRCAYRPKTRTPILPAFSNDDRPIDDEGEELRRQAHAGLQQRLIQTGPVAGYSTEDYEKRLDFELDVINRMEFPGYFLIVADFIKWSKEQGIPVGPGRGSGAGSLVAYALTITDLDPLRFNLLFERFLNPERVSMPDFDIDFCQDRRDEVINYVQAKYGSDQVAQIITFGKLQARAVCRDVGRVLQMPYGQVDRLCKLIPMNPANPVSLAQAIEGEPRLQGERDSDETVAAMLEIALKLEGLYRHASTHAAGIVIGDRPLDELVPLYLDPRSSMPATQFNLKWVEPAGLVKFDFLGLKTLTVINRAEALIRQHQPEFDAAQIPLDDPATYEMLGRGETIGVFQLESSGMRDVLRKIHADSIEDIIAIVALYRPGPMDNIPNFINRKRGREKIDYLHPWFEELLKETYGIIVYQEQVMQIAQIMAGYSLGEADLLRRAMGKKIKAEMDAQKERFISGAVDKEVDPKKAGEIFELVAKFAGYGFNKSHAACYAVVAYQTAYLKANYPVEFLAASMTLDMGNTDKLQVFHREAQRMEIKINPPDVNSPAIEFHVENGEIRYALAALKNVGKAAIEHLFDVRNQGGEFKSISDFANRINPQNINRRALESLIKAGGLSTINPNRAQLIAGIDTILGTANRAAADAAQGQSDLFSGENAETVQDLHLPLVEPWLPLEQLNHEFDAVGFYLSGHPLDEYMPVFARMNVKTSQQFQLDVLNKGARAARLAGTVMYRQERRARSGNRFAFIGFSDPSGQYECICFSDTLAHAGELLEPGQSVLATVEADVENEDVRLKLNAVEALTGSKADISEGLSIYLHDATPLNSIKMRLQNSGNAPVHVIFMGQNQRPEIELELGKSFTVTPEIKGAIKAIPGVVDVKDL